jgi:hypothetical protein
MDAEEFKIAWGMEGGSLVRFCEDDLAGANLPSETRSFLLEAGLPSEAAPFLTFAPEKLGWIPQSSRPAGFDTYIAIGSNGSGDPVVVASSGAILYLNHDRNFTPIYINRDVATLAESLLRYRSLILETQRVGGPDAYLDGAVPAHLRDDFVNYLTAADPKSLEAGAMWTEELASYG